MSRVRESLWMAAFVVVTAPLVAPCVPGGLVTGVCPCTPCVFAVQLAVFETDTSIPLDDFDVTVSLNGDTAARPAECEPEARTDNTCSFGFEAGVYHMVVSAPGHAPREMLIRQADEEAAECCNGACKRAKTADVFLDAL